MKLILNIFLFLIVNSIAAQQVIFEKTFGSPYAEFKPNAMAVDKDGMIYITGRYETSVEFFTTRNGHTVYADTTLPYDTHMYLYKIDADGKLLKRVFINALEGLDITITKEGNVLVTGFMNRYRKENYKGDRTQGVYTVLMNTDLEVIWDKIYPSYYNSVANKIIETTDEKIVIIAHSLTKKDSVSQLDDITETRIIKTDKNGKLLKDTIIPSLPYLKGLDVEYSKFLPANKFPENRPPLFLTYDIKEITTGYLLAATNVSNGYGKYPAGENFLLLEMDKEFNVKKIKSFIFNKDKRVEKDINYATSMTINEGQIMIAGTAQYSDKENIVVLLNSNYDTVFTRHTGKSYSFNEPKIILLEKRMYAVCNATKDNHLTIDFVSEAGTVKEFDFGSYYINDFSDIKVSGNYIYVLAHAKENIIQTYLAKIKYK